MMNNQTLRRAISFVIVCISFALFGVNANATCTTSISNTSTSSSTLTSSADYECISNSGTINSGDGIHTYTHNYNTIVNTGTINAGSTGIFSDLSYSTISNTGTITAGNSGINIDSGYYNTITNTGTITASITDVWISGSYTGNITLNNAQGGSGAIALTLHGYLPTNYNIIIDSPTHYGQLEASAGGSMTFGIYAGSNITSTQYNSVLLNVIGQVTNTTGTYDNLNWTLNQHNMGYNLDFSGVSLMQTQASLAQSAAALRGVYDLQNVEMNNNMNTDCNLFDVHGICTAVSGTQTNLGGGVGSDLTTGKLTVAYKVNDNVHVGAYLDQTLNASTATGVNLSNGGAALGAFAVWNANADGLGTQIRLTAGYNNKDLTVTRQVTGIFSEAGSGTTNLNSYGVAAMASYAMLMQGDIIFTPYLGLRYTKVSADGYTEQANVNVTDPLTYSALTQDATTALIGTKWTKAIGDKAMAYVSLGLEQDLSNNGGTYTATSANIFGLTPIAFNANINRTRPTASISSYYNLGDTQRVAANLVWSEEAFTSANATTLMLTYMAGF